MRALIRKNVHIWGFGKAFVLFLGCLVFSLSERVNTPLSFEQYLLSAVSDHYYLTLLYAAACTVKCFSIHRG